jgi:hypothetical protein
VKAINGCAAQARALALIGCILCTHFDGVATGASGFLALWWGFMAAVYWHASSTAWDFTRASGQGPPGQRVAAFLTVGIVVAVAANVVRNVVGTREC